MIEIWIPIGISLVALAISILSLHVSWLTKNPDFHFEKIVPEKNYGVQRAIVTNNGFAEGIIYADCGIAYHSWFKMRHLKIPFIEFYNGHRGQNMYGSDSTKAWDDGGQLLKVDAKTSVALLFNADILQQKLSGLNVRYVYFYANVSSSSPIKKTKAIYSPKIAKIELKDAIPYPKIITYSNETTELNQ